MSTLYMMMAITKRSIQNRLKELYKRNGLEVTFMTLARGTASNEILDCFGLEATEKLIRFSVVTDRMWRNVKADLEQQIRIDVPGTGIAFVVPLSSIGGRNVLEFLTDGQAFEKEEESVMKKENWKALLPIGVFLVLYLGLGILFEYVMKIPMGFYNVPIVVSFLAALLVACVQNPKLNFDEKLAVMARGVGDKNIVTMILIFLAAGVFVGVVGRSSAESVAYCLLSLIPVRFAVVVLFVVSAFVSLAMGTSVGTITLLTPIAVAVAEASGFGAAACVGAVVGGAMFGDNLSFISDTTIAACNGQGCAMRDKFRANFKIAFPAALAACVVIFLMTAGPVEGGRIMQEYNLVQVIPYILVLVGGIAGINVFVVLLIGIVSGALIMLVTGNVTAVDLLTNMGSGASGMYETIMVTILVSAIGGLIGEYGGFDALLNFIKRVFRSRNGGKLGIGLLVGALDIATANNTVAIVMANPIAKDMSEEYGITPQNTASILDTFSCIFQGVIPYGAQMLIALSASAELGCELSAFDVMPNLIYPYMLLISSLIFMFFVPDKKRG